MISLVNVNKAVNAAPTFALFPALSMQCYWIITTILQTLITPLHVFDILTWACTIKKIAHNFFGMKTIKTSFGAQIQCLLVSSVKKCGAQLQCLVVSSV